MVAGISGSPRGGHVIRAAAPLARADDADLAVIHVSAPDGRSARQHKEPQRNRITAVELGGSFDEIEGSAPARALADVALSRGASRVVVASQRARLGKSTRRSLAARLRRLLPAVTVDEVCEG